MSVALGKVKGIEKVNVTLKRGVAHITLAEGNAVTLPQLRRIIKDAGYVSRDAVVNARGTLLARGNELRLDLSGTSTALRLAADPAHPEVLANLRKAAGGASSVEVSGTISGATGDRQEDTVIVRSFTILP